MPLYSPDTTFSSRDSPRISFAGFVAKGVYKGLENKKRTRANLFYDTGLMVSKKDNLRPPLK